MTVLPSNFRVYVSVLIGHLAIGISLFCVAWTSPILAKLEGLEDNPLGRIVNSSSLESTLIASFPTIGGLVGSYLFPFLAKVFGRRPAMISVMIPNLFAYPLLAVSTNIWEIYIARFLCGLSLGGATTVDTIYFAEISGAAERAFLGTAMMIFMNMGGLFVLIIGPATSYFVFHVILSMFSPIYLILAYFFMSETPFYLVQADFTKAEACLKKLRGSNNVEKELYDIDFSCKNKIQVNAKDIFRNVALRRGIIIGVGLTTFQQLTGSTIVSTYGQELFEQVEGGIPSSVVPIISSASSFSVSFLAPVVISRFGIRKMLFFSTIGVCVSLFIFGGYFVAKSNGISVSSLSFVPFIGMLMYGVMNSVGFGPISQVILGEIFPMQFKEIVNSLCSIVFYISTFLMLMLYPYMRDALGLGAEFWIYSAFALLCTIFSYFYVIETKGKTLNEIIAELNVL